MVNKLLSKIECWKSKLRSFGAKITLVKSTLNSLALHVLSVSRLSSSTIKHIHKVIVSFLWNNIKERRRHWVKMDNIFKPISQAGLGLDSIKFFMEALHRKLTWRYAVGDSLFAKLLNFKYGEPRDTCFSDKKKNSSYLWSLFHPKIHMLLNDYVLCKNPFNHRMVVCWKHHTLGKFNVKTWKSYASANNIQFPVFKNVWNSNIPTKISGFIWKI